MSLWLDRTLISSIVAMSSGGLSTVWKALRNMSPSPRMRQDAPNTRLPVHSIGLRCGRYVPDFIPRLIFTMSQHIPKHNSGVTSIGLSSADGSIVMLDVWILSGPKTVFRTTKPNSLTLPASVTPAVR
ncbi:hypothetical protein JB92DRAFT_463662 [Gautieria morchelliformis]|nr:hypothetical protein JB92DRAFT_463662 [Gautieria morchelliformis]